ncbi:MAG: hypothetical protein QM802_14370 [Agriterribacter sp.]
MYRNHSGLTVVVNIHPLQKEELRKKLKELNTNPDRLPFSDCESVLFASGVIINSEKYNNETLPDIFILATSYSGKKDDHIQELVSKCKQGLLEILRYGEDFPVSETISDHNLFSYMYSHSLFSDFSSGYDCMTKEDINREKDLRAKIEDYLDDAQSTGAFENRSALEIQTLIQRFVKTRGADYEWALKPDRKSFWEWVVLHRSAVTAGIIYFLTVLVWYLCNPVCNCMLNRFLSALLYAALFLTGIVLITAGILFFIMWLIARDKNLTAERQPDEKIRFQAASQLHPVVNEMTAAGHLKKGKLRRLYYSFILRLLAFIYAGSGVPTVSTIRWLATDNKKRMVFLSNYVNTTDFYVRDFLNGITPIGVNLLFSSAFGFPDAKLLFIKGIGYQPEGYMNAVHYGQVVTDLWYAHDPNLTVDIINRNRKLRNGLFKKMSEYEAARWLKLL